MNVAKAIELAAARVLRTYATLGAGTSVRAWQSIPVDGSWDKDQDRTLPMIDVRCSPPSTGEAQSIMTADMLLLCRTKTDDDRDHAFISAMYGAVQGVCDSMFSQFRLGTDGDELTAFKAALSSELGDTFNTASIGLTWGDSATPYEDGSENVIGIGMIIHYSRTDF